MELPERTGRKQAAKGSAVVAAAAAMAMLAGCSARIGNALGANDAGSSDAPWRADAALVTDAPAVDAPAAIDAVPADAIPCDGGDRHFLDPDNGHCYLLFTTAATWSDAEADCESAQAHLATSTNKRENVVLTTVGAGQKDVWLGGTDMAMEGIWVWVTGESMGFQNWRSGEPNGGTAENCMVLEPNNGGTWDDLPCGETFPYLCERD